MRRSFFYVELSMNLQSEANVVMNDIFDILDSVSSILLRNFASIFSRKINMKFLKFDVFNWFENQGNTGFTKRI